MYGTKLDNALRRCKIIISAYLQATNRLLLKWLKQWDYVVFGKECKLPKGEQKKDQKPEDKGKENTGKDGKGKPFFKKNVPEVLDELDQHKRPMNKVSFHTSPLLHICPGLTFESGFHSLVLSLNRHYGKAVVNVEEPGCNTDYLLILPVSNKRNRAFWENSALWVLV